MTTMLLPSHSGRLRRSGNMDTTAGLPSARIGI
jgi:hypothetical protein